LAPEKLLSMSSEFLFFFALRTNPDIVVCFCCHRAVGAVAIFALLALLALGGELRLLAGGELVVELGGLLAAGADGLARGQERVLLVLDHEDTVRGQRALQADGTKTEHVCCGCVVVVVDLE